MKYCFKSSFINNFEKMSCRHFLLDVEDSDNRTNMKIVRKNLRNKYNPLEEPENR